jgi:signal transduction histidine kinase
MYALLPAAGENDRVLRSRTLAAGAIVAGAVVLSWLYRDAAPRVPGWLLPGAVVLPLWLLADAATIRRRRARSLAEQARLLDRERDAAARVAVDAERARIARELHDVVSHTVSVMIVQAGAARHAVSHGAAGSVGATDAMRAVEASGREAMTELRRMLDLLAPAADGSDEVDLVPLPGLDRLDALVDRVAFAGLPVTVHTSGAPRPLPPGLDLTAYRIIQEALTNALKHAPAARAEVYVRYSDRYLRLEVLNTGPSVLSGGSRFLGSAADRAGRGLLGLRERVAVYGGDLDARSRLGGGYRVRARIPLDPA